MDDIKDGTSEVACDVLVIGGGTAGPMAALKAKLKNPKATVILLEKANVKRSGAISMGMDGLNNAVIPGYATPEQYTKEITIANDGIVNQKAVYKYAQRCYSVIEELDSFGTRFLKNENGDFAVKKVHHIGSYVLPMPNGETVKKAVYRQLRRARLLISNRYMATRLLTGPDGRAAGAIAVNTRTAEFLVIKAKAVILCMGAAGRLGLPTSGYMFGTYENAANSGDGLCHGVSRRRGAREPRMLPDQPADQGLQRPRLRLCGWPFRRLYGQQRRRPLHRMRLLVRPDDAGILQRDCSPARVRSSSR